MSDKQEEIIVKSLDPSAEMMLDTSTKKQIQLIAIADNKANMITAICAALIFLIIALFSSGFSLTDSPLLERLEFVIPLGILLVFCSVSVICAILALKPKIVRSKSKDKSVLFFHNYYRKTLDQYKEEMYEVMESRDTIYDHMIKNMYYNGLVLERKYALLGFAYTIFLTAIICSVMSYVVLTVF
ncbi:MAG: hypothetical protein HKN67_11165 [Saprospiraceae bacterium]|nr:hypothetical protein [Saprospiraceae bacterium]NNK89808.1 hypothetical protein [Saprospiraceae bacterium]